ncbi:hypothetical protein [Halorussus litoreus]|uniref:hypothetical protein n=1 Tax=Halorussus litoreus TaxID=1710536 RepID=UPI0018E54D5F|nr:hypothetical protein [Halorussus litoreus]
MSDGSGSDDDRADRTERKDRGDSREPLGEVAEKVRERTGKTRAGSAERRDQADAPARDGPMADVATKVDERRQRDRERESTDPFESVDVGELDGEKLWERLADEEGEGPSVTVPAGESVAVEDRDEWAGRDVRTIPKETCHGCPHFADPPDLACTHEGTAILAMTDSEHFRVVDCPMVGEEEDIGSIAVDGDAASDGGAGAVGGEHGTDVVDTVDAADTE